MNGKAARRVPLHRRSLEFEAFEESDDELLVVGHLQDRRPWVAERGEGSGEVHDMELHVRVRLPDLTITHAEAVMHAFPHSECPAIVAAFSGLAGLSVARGFTKAVQDLVAGPKGCTHLDQLARSMGPVVIQAVTSRRARRLRDGVDDEVPGGIANAPWARNTCHVWSEGGVAPQKLAAGWRPGVGPYPAPPLEAILAGAPDDGGSSDSAEVERE